MAQRSRDKSPKNNNEAQQNLPSTSGRRQYDKPDPETAQKIEEYLEEANFPESLRTLLEKLPLADRVRIIAEKEISYTSPYPPPEIFKQYPDDIQQAIVTRTGKEQDHRHKMDEGELKISQDDQKLKIRGQIIGAILIPAIIFLLFLYARFSLRPEDQLEAFKAMLWFIAIVVGIFVTSRVVTGIENIFGRKDKE